MTKVSDDSDQPDEIRKHDNEIVKKAVQGLMMHFDTVQVFVSRHDAGSEQTVGCSIGEGNWYARFGQIHEWLKNGGVMSLSPPKDDEAE